MTVNEMLTLEVAKRLNQIMEDRHMNATELSKASGVGKSDISNYLKGKYRPKQEKIAALAAALEVDPAWLGAIDLQMETNAKVRKELNNTIDAQVVSTLSTLSPEGVQKVLDYARLVALAEQTKE